MKIALIVAAASMSSAAIAQMPSQLTGTPPAAASLQIVHESGNSYYEPGAAVLVNNGGPSPQLKAKYAKIHAEKVAKTNLKSD
nr:hypothetical protein [Polymorphobacter sp.]